MAELPNGCKSLLFSNRIFIDQPPQRFLLFPDFPGAYDLSATATPN